MKVFPSMFAACVLAVLVSLLAYDVFVAQPREDRMQAALNAAIASAAEAGLAGRREQAAQVASALDASVDRTIANARAAMAQEAAAVDTRGRIAEGLTRASMFKVAVLETYMSNGRWPLQASDAGLSAPESYAAGAVTAIALGTEGSIAIRYDDSVAPGAEIRLVPQVRVESGSVEWRCEANGFPDRSLLPAGCR